jgi:hypothetical protein
VSLTGEGNGTAPFVQLAPTSVSFGSQLVGTPSTAQDVTLTNTGNATLTISGIATTGNFTQTNTCGTIPASVLAGANCTISVTFTPTAVGTQVGTLTIADNAASSPQNVILSGIGAGVGLSATALTFPDTAFTTPTPTVSAPQTVTLTNTSASLLTFTSIAITGTNSGDFGETDNCTPSVAPGGTCTINVTFAPTATGTRTAAVVITDSGPNSPRSIGLVGGGVTPTVIVVNTTAQIATSPADCTLGDAIRAANGGTTVNGCVGGLGPNTINVPAGTYHLTRVNNSNRNAATPDIASTITIQGAGAVTTIIQRDPGSPDFGILSLTSGTLTLNDVTLKGGEPAVGAYYSYGTININRCTFDSNPTGAINGGWNSGAFYLSSLTIGNSTFTNNSNPNNYGGALYGSASVLTITNSLFSGNVATYYGGAVYISGGTISIANSSFVNNSSTANGYYGGAIYINSGTSASIQSCNFSGNGAGYGGAVSDYNAPLTILNSAFTNNSAANQGGALYLQSNGVNANITASTFSGNTAGDAGGAIYRYYGTVGQVTKLTNTTISSNTANNWGGGMALYNYSGGLDLNNVTIANNTAQNGNNSAGGGGIAFVNLNPNDFFTFENSIIAGNTDPTNVAPDCSTVQMGDGPVLTSLGYNLIGNNTGCSFLPAAGDQVGTASSPINPQLGPLQNNGVGTFVCGPNEQSCPANSTLALLGGSPAIDAGNPATPGPVEPACAATDERGLPRPLGVACDIGAFEADIQVSPVSQAFPPEAVGVKSPAETITFTNYGSAPLTITGITITGDFALDVNTTTCSTSTPLGAGSPCAVGVTFTPTAAGTRPGTLTIASSDPSSPVTVSLSGEGNGTAPFVILAPTSLSFVSQLVGTSSTQGVTLTNQGNAPLLITGITTTGNFAQTNTCGSSVAAAGSCTISVTFTPTVVGTQVGTLTIADNAAGSPHGVILSGVGIGVGLSGTALTFGNQALNTTSAAQTVTLTNTSTGNLSITAVSASGDFALDPTTTCSGSTTLGPSGTCTLAVTFTPTATGTRTGAVTITDDGPNSPQSIALVGAGVTTQLIVVNTTAQMASRPTDCTLGDAITAANTDTAVNGCAAGSGADTIMLPAGTYHLTRVNNSSRNAATPDISTAITIQGAGQGTTILERDASAPTFEILSLIYGTLTLNDVALKGGEPAVWASYYYYYYYNVTLNINRCTFDSNPGGAINYSVSNLTIDNSTFTNNSNPNSYGGALYGSANVLTITNSLFSGNTASYYGAALYISGGTISIANSSFMNNASSSTSYYYYGGAIYINGGTSAAINSCNFSGNSGGSGGAVFDYNVPLTVLNSAFTNNSASSDGGALYLENSAANTSITGSTFFGNTAGDTGGAIYRYSGTAGQVTKLTNTTISGNTASNAGGGMAVYSSGGLDLNNVTIANNTAQNGNSSAGGGGIAFLSLNNTDFYTFENSIIAGNTDATNVAPDCSTVQMGDGPVLTSQGYNLLGNSTGCTATAATGDQVGTASSPLNPQLGPLQNNGVGTFVCGPNEQSCPANSTLALLGGSPAIDAGNPETPGSGATACAATDERGLPRPLGAACDIGAFEADINVSPVSQAFPPEAVGVTSPAETITFTNYGSAALTITGITITGDFAQDSGTTTCSTSLGAASNCAVGVTFTPTAAGTRTGTLMIASSDPSSPVTVSLSGEGNATAPFVLLTPASLSFGNQLVGTSSTQGVTLTNQGNAPLVITGITTTGNFAQTNNCVSPVAAAGSCTISVTFTPTVVGTQVGMLMIADNAAGSPHGVVLSGVGIGVGLSGTALTFGNQALNTTSGAQTVTLTNTSTSNLSITAVSASGDFGLDPTTTCSGSTTLGPGGTCTIAVTFTPTATGTRTGAVTITDDGPNSPQSIALVGAGVTTQLIVVNTTAQLATSPTDCTLGDAIKAANTDTVQNGCAAGSGADTIMLPAGTYHLTRINNSNNSAATPDIYTTITIQGAGQGTTILQRDSTAPTFEILSLTTNGALTLNDVTLKGGEPAVATSYYSYNATLNINRCTFDSNPAGAITSYYYYYYYGGLSSLTIDSSTFTNNSNSNGGALYGSANVLTITNSLFSGNTATYDGGAIYIYNYYTSGTISIANSSFVNNSSSSSSSSYQGGAIYIYYGTSAAINSCNFSGNSGGYGGAVYDYNVPLTIGNSAFTNNTASYDGGALYLEYGAANTSVTASTFSGNTAGDSGGAIYRLYGNTGQVTKLTNTTITGNTATNWGGGMTVYGYYSSYGGGLELNNVTIANNTAQNSDSSAGGGGLALVTLSSSDNYKFENSIIAGNTDATNVAPDCSTVNIGSGTLTSQGYNLVGNNTGCTFAAATGDQVGTGASPINPLLGPVVNNGGATFICGPAGQMCPPNSTQALLAGSPAIDTGNPATPGSGEPACAATDERGVTRPAGTACDIGAYEQSATAAAILSATSLTFGNQMVNSVSSPQTVTLTNPASASMGITSIVASGDFTQTNTCGTSLAAGASCTVTVFFAPTVAGTRTGLLALTDDASNSPQTVSLSGSAVSGGAPAVTLSLTLTFPNQNLNETSAPQTVTVTNSGTAVLNVASVAINGDFAQSSACVGAVAAGVACPISVTFTPTTTGQRTGTLTVTDNAPGSPHVVAISGKGVLPAVSLSAASLTFAGNPVGMDCPTKTVTLSNPGDGQLNISSIVASAEFLQTNDCGLERDPGAGCVISVKFQPAAVGATTGTVTITSDAPGSPHTVALTGNGTPACALLTSSPLATVLRGADSVDFTISDQKPSCTPDPIQLTCTVNNPATCKLAQTTIQPTGSTTLTVANLKALGADPVTVEVVKRSDFRVAAVDMQVRVSDFIMTEYPQAATVAAGRTANYSLTLASVNGLKGSVQMGCQGAPAGATCTVTPAQVTLDGATPVQITVSVSTTARSQGVPRVPPPQAPQWVWPLALTMLASLILASRRRRPALILAALLLMAVVWAACGGGGRMVSTTSTGTPAGSYSIQVTGTYTAANGATSSLSHIVDLALTVN